jgi:hypothetical protein
MAAFTGGDVFTATRAAVFASIARDLLLGEH